MKLLLVAATCVMLAVSGALFADTTDRRPPPIDVGNFEGTWYYTDPAYRIAIFVEKDKTGLLRLRYHVRTKGGSEYETDAGGYAKSIDEDGNVVEVFLSATPVGPNKITGHYERTVYIKKTRLVESADFEMYRAEMGKKLVVTYPIYKTERFDPNGRAQSSTETQVIRLFRKVSEIAVDFDEIDF